MDNICDLENRLEPDSLFANKTFPLTDRLLCAIPNTTKCFHVILCKSDLITTDANLRTCTRKFCAKGKARNDAAVEGIVVGILNQF